VKANANFRFAIYSLLVTVAFAGLAFFPSSEMPAPLLLLLLSGFALSKNKSASSGPQRSISDRALVLGFLGFLVVSWVGTLTVAHFLAPGQRLEHLLWIFYAAAWACGIYEGYRWWRWQKIDA
jgi:hypothetical protein